MRIGQKINPGEDREGSGKSTRVRIGKWLFLFHLSNNEWSPGAPMGSALQRPW